MAAKILAVDDEPHIERLILQRFRRKIRSGEYEFVFAANGLEALQKLEEDPDIDIVLSDINMPEMDGLSLISKLKEVHPLLKTIIVSAYGDMQNIRTAMNLGAFDFVTKPIDFPDLETTIDKTLEEADLLKEAERARELEANNVRLKEIDQLKTQFFTNISHEFRTPLTVITGMANQIGENPDQWLDRGLLMIRRNSDNLLDLVNQILDLRKLESGTMQLNLINGDIIAYLKYLLESFASLAETKDVRLDFKSAPNELEMDYDPEKILRIFSNLLANAIKFTPEGGTVGVKLEQDGDQLLMAISDTGVGIASEKLNLIFDRFFQIDDDQSLSFSEGTGIGLALVKELVRLMNGQIQVSSTEGEGTSFSIHLPIKSEAPKKASHPDQELVQAISSTQEVLPAVGLNSEADLPNLLIVEDNPDVATYIQSCIQGMYHTDWAKDGEEGWEKALANIPDLIISDVMMPKKDGLELCDNLKKDQRTSHIPIVLLTAKADIDSRIAGLKRGADAYLAKPFNREELLIRLEKLLDLRKALQARYQSVFDLPQQESAEEAQEDQFIIDIRQTIEDNLDDETFGIHELCRAIGMSRTQLHRKLKALTGKSTSHFVRAIRLHKAKELLTKTNLNISQVAYEVGFKDPKYFSRTFSEEFGVSPNQWRS